MDINSKYTTVSLFSGAGGLDLGLSWAGMNIIWANDILPIAVKNYKHNIGNIIQEDIKKIDINDIPTSDIVVGGFPCQPFSSAGNRRGIEDDRGNLYLEIIKVVNSKDPKVVIFENVRGILSMKNKDGSNFFDTVIHLLQNTGYYGYDVTYKLIKASDYKVPQNRYRVIIVAFRKDLEVDYQFPEPTTVPEDDLTIRSIINVNEKIPNKNDIWELSPQSKALIKHIPEGGSWKNVPYEFLPDRLKRIKDNMKKYHSPNFYRRFSRNEIAGTITAAATPENSGSIHPIEDRRFSVREIARIQTFPDNYEFIGSVSGMYKIIGNAVPPKIGEVIGKSIIEALDSVDIVKEFQLF